MEIDGAEPYGAFHRQALRRGALRRQALPSLTDPYGALRGLAGPYGALRSLTEPTSIEQTSNYPFGDAHHNEAASCLMQK